MGTDPSHSFTRLEGRRRGVGSPPLATDRALKDRSFWWVRASLVGWIRLQEPQPRASAHLAVFRSPSTMSYDLSVIAGDGR